MSVQSRLLPPVICSVEVDISTSMSFHGLLISCSRTLDNLTKLVILDFGRPLF